jgi:hypothetical protein
MTKDAQKLLHKLEMAVAPPRAASKKKATRKKATAKKSSQKAAAGD